MAVDTHAHIFKTGLDLAPVRRYAPGYDATVEDYLAVLDKHGVSHGVLVQPSFLGVNNSYLIEALRRHPQRLRGIAVVEPDIDFEALAAMGDDGIVGIRLNLTGMPIPHFRAGPWPQLFGHLRRLDWQIEVMRTAPDLPLIIDPLLDAGLTVVVDHYGLPDDKAGENDAGFQHLLESARSRRVWVKMSGAYRNWPDIDDLSRAKQCTARLLEAFGPERLIWGSDWPHTQNENTIKYEMTQRPLQECVPNAADRTIILQDAPLRLFRFNRPAGE